VNLIQIENVSYKYEESKTYALQNVTMAIEGGECVAIIGENGSGKTTLIKHINGLLRSDKGKIFIKGEDVSKKTIAEIARTVGFIFQNPDHMIFADTVKEEISFGPQNLGFPKEDIEKRVEEVLSFTRLQQYKDTHPMSLSGGEKQRLALASIIVSHPEILILDEPTTGFDYNSVKDMVQLVQKLKNEGKTIILVTHDMTLVSRLATRAIVMKDGSIIADGPLRDIYENEEILKATYLEQPYALKLSKLLGIETCLTPEEVYNEISGETR